MRGQPRMAFIDEVKTEAEKTKRIRCSVAIWLETQPDVSDEDLRAAADEPGTTAMLIHGAMKGRGYTATYAPVQRHLRGDCSCRS